MCIDLLDQQNAKNLKTHFKIFEFPSKTGVSMFRNMTLFSSSGSWHEDLKFGPRIDVFDPIEPEISTHFDASGQIINRNIKFMIWLSGI